MSLIDFNKPKKKNSTEEHNRIYQSDANVAGTFVPNMSEDDTKKWKGKHIKGEDERIEIRKTIGGTQLLIVVFKAVRFAEWVSGKAWKDQEWYKNHNSVRISMNSKVDMTFDDYNEMTKVIEEAKTLLNIE